MDKLPYFLSCFLLSSKAKHGQICVFKGSGKSGASHDWPWVCTIDIYTMPYKMNHCVIAVLHQTCLSFIAIARLLHWVCWPLYFQWCRVKGHTSDSWDIPLYATPMLRDASDLANWKYESSPETRTDKIPDSRKVNVTRISVYSLREKLSCFNINY